MVSVGTPTRETLFTLPKPRVHLSRHLVNTVLQGGILEEGDGLTLI